MTIPSPHRTDWRVVTLVFCVGLLAAWQFGKVSLTLDAMSAQYDRPAVALAYLVSIVGVVGMIFGVMAGDLVAALGTRRVFLGCLVLGACVSVVQAVLPGLSLLTLLRVIEGVSHLGLVVAGPPIMAQASSPRDRPVVMALWAMFFGVAFALAAVVFVPVMAWGGLGALFAVHAAACVVMAALLWPLLPSEPRRPVRLDPVAQHRVIYATARYAAPGLGFVFYTSMFVALLTFLPGALSVPELAVTLPLISLVGTFAAGWLARRMPPDLVMALGFASTIVLTGLLWAGLFWAVFPLFLTMGLIPGGAFALIPHLNETTADRGRATGAIAQMGNVGTTCGTPFFALALAMGGLNGLYLGLILLGALGGLAVMFARRWVARSR